MLWHPTYLSKRTKSLPDFHHRRGNATAPRAAGLGPAYNFPPIISAMRNSALICSGCTHLLPPPPRPPPPALLPPLSMVYTARSAPSSAGRARSTLSPPSPLLKEEDGEDGEATLDGCMRGEASRWHRHLLRLYSILSTGLDIQLYRMHRGQIFVYKGAL